MANLEQAPTWVQGMEERIRSSIRDELAPVKTKLTEMDTRLVTVESKQESMDKRHASLEQGGAGNASQSFQPGWVDVKGFCDYKDRKTQGISRPEASTLVQLMVSWLPDDLKKHVGEFILTGGKSFSVRIPATPTYCREISSIWKDKFEETSYKFRDSKELFVTLQRPPEIQAQYSTLGKLLDFAVDNCDVLAAPRAFWNPDFELHLETNDEGPKATKIAKVEPGGKIIWELDALKLLGFGNPEEANKGLSQFKRGRK